ncbi:phosphoribosylaminoimidazole carboxylase [Streptococcus saliviloxodontae]|uniref:Phosphoribosylaminoimidazole carboxylase n=1 Tax=Streptococcus saliviloxodontae TaxID=1349416 RepID=A0ABS2PM08_9STRE|nr:phosphoribosylaminoimidazole carboxylase [Streptococcus saliviloxodontae]MBM7636470.1 hypothetical protein [Streptococcus saliviloxodontae]
MIQLIVHAFLEDSDAVVEVLYASSQPEKLSAKMTELQEEFPQDYLAIYDLPLDTDLSQLPHYPSVLIEKSDFQ